MYIENKTGLQDQGTLCHFISSNLLDLISVV